MAHYLDWPARYVFSEKFIVELVSTACAAIINAIRNSSSKLTLKVYCRVRQRRRRHGGCPQAASIVVGDLRQLIQCYYFSIYFSNVYSLISISIHKYSLLTYSLHKYPLLTYSLIPIIIHKYSLRTYLLTTHNSHTHEFLSVIDILQYSSNKINQSVHPCRQVQAEKGASTGSK